MSNISSLVRQLQARRSNDPHVEVIVAGEAIYFFNPGTKRSTWTRPSNVFDWSVIFEPSATSSCVRMFAKLAQVLAGQGWSLKNSLET